MSLRKSKLKTYQKLLLSILIIAGLTTLSSSSFIGNGKESISLFNKKFTINLKKQTEGINEKENIIYEFLPISKNQTEVTCKVNRINFNPFDFDYTYHIERKKEDASILIDMISVMDPMNFYISDNMTQDYKGDKLTFPKELVVGTDLPKASGTLITSNSSLKIEIDVVVSNRKVLKTEPINIDGNSYETFVLSYQVEEKYRAGNNTIVSTKVNQFTDWFTPEYGVLKRTANQKYQDNSSNRIITNTHSLTTTIIQLF